MSNKVRILGISPASNVAVKIGKRRTRHCWSGTRVLSSVSLEEITYQCLVAVSFRETLIAVQTLAYGAGFLENAFILESLQGAGVLHSSMKRWPVETTS